MLLLARNCNCSTHDVSFSLFFIWTWASNQAKVFVSSSRLVGAAAAAAAVRRIASNWTCHIVRAQTAHTYSSIAALFFIFICALWCLRFVNIFGDVKQCNNTTTTAAVQWAFFKLFGISVLDFFFWFLSFRPVVVSYLLYVKRIYTRMTRSHIRAVWVCLRCLCTESQTLAVIGRSMTKQTSINKPSYEFLEAAYVVFALHARHLCSNTPKNPRN